MLANKKEFCEISHNCEETIRELTSKRYLCQRINPFNKLMNFGSCYRSRITIIRHIFEAAKGDGAGLMEVNQT